MATRLLRSDALVENHGQLTKAAADHLSDVHYLAIARLPEGADQGIDSYLRQLRRRLAALALSSYKEVRNVSVDKAASHIRAAQGRPGATIIMTPDNALDALLAVLAEDPNRDGDGMTPEGLALRWPATTRSIRGLAESEVGPLKNFDPARIAVVGSKGEVQTGVLAYLAQDGIFPGRLIDKHNTAEELPNLHRNADLVISATGVAGLLTAGALLRQRSDGQNARPITVIDAGVSLNPKTGMTHGDVDPFLYTYAGKQELVITPAPVLFPDGHAARNGRGVGALTVDEYIAGGVRPVARPLAVTATVS